MMKKNIDKTYAPPVAREYVISLDCSIMQGSGSNESYNDKDDLSDLWDDGYWD